ncbi:MAG TPA: winged helix-turn-helix domain-containing protein, partial [Burkholderiaceae bacterium]
MSLPSLFFDRFELQPLQRRLLCDGMPLELRARAFDLLLALTERAGSLVTKSELLQRVWPGRVVEENNIAAQIVALRKVIGGELIATIPGRGYRFTGEVRRSTEASAGVAAVPAPRPALRSDAPALIGRDTDLAQVHVALRAGTCVTLVGAGGVGKTVLARAAVAAWTTSAPPAHPDALDRMALPRRAAWVDLAAIDSADLLTGAVCRALAIAEPATPIDDVARAIGAATASDAWLLVLDNAEHVVDSVAELATGLLATAPTLALLVTSQLPLRIAGERVQPLDPLELPAEDTPDDQALAAASVRLLLDRV